MRTNKSDFGKIVMVIALCFLQCTPEQSIDDIGSESTTDLIQNIKSNYERLKAKSIPQLAANLKTELQIDWDIFNIRDHDGTSWYEFQVISDDVKVASSRITNVNYSLLVALSGENDPVYFINKMSSYNNQEYNSYYGLNEGLFSGTVNIISLFGDNLVLQYYKKGELVSMVSDKDFDNIFSIGLSAQCDQKASLSARCESTTDCDPPLMPGCTGGSQGHWELQYTGHYTDWYMDRNGNGSAESGEYSSTDFNGYSSEYVWVPDSTSGTLYGTAWTRNMYNYSGTSYSNLSYDPNQNTTIKRLVIETLTFDENPCMKPILKKLTAKDRRQFLVPDISEAGVSHLTQTILDIFDSSQEYSVDFKVEQLGNDANGNELNGRTVKSRTKSNTWEIIIDSDLINRGTRLFIAKTIIHETLHAFIKYALNKNRGSDLVLDLNAIQSGNYLGNNDAQNLTHHQFFSQYIDALSRSLAIWDDYRLPMDYYKKLSWGGLETSNAYKSKSETEKTNIQKAINDERYNKPGAQGTPCD